MIHKYLGNSRYISAAENPSNLMWILEKENEGIFSHVGGLHRPVENCPFKIFPIAAPENRSDLEKIG